MTESFNSRKTGLLYEEPDYYITYGDIRKMASELQEDYNHSGDIWLGEIIAFLVDEIEDLKEETERNVKKHTTTKEA